MIGALASQPQYAQHLVPIVEAIGGTLYRHMNDVRRGGGHDLWLVASQADFAALGRDRRRVFMEHGCGLEWYRGGKLLRLRQAVAVLAPNAMVAGWHSDANPGVPVHVIGTPKLDRLVGVEHGKAATVSLHWSGIYGHPRGTDSLVRWSRAFTEFARHTTVLGHAHPRVWQQAQRAYRTMGIEPVQDFEEVVQRSWLYLCDHSSTIYEFGALGGNVVLLDPPTPSSRLSGLRYQMHGWVGPHARPQDNLLSAVAMISPAHQQARHAATRELYPYLGSATARAVEVLESIG